MTQMVVRNRYGSWLRWLAALLLALFCWASAVPAAAAEALPRYRGDIYAQDFTGTLSRDTLQRIDMAGYQLERATGAQIVVAMVRDVPNGDMDAYATDLFRYWGIGSKSKDNGILLLVSLADRKVRIEVGYGLEGALNDAKAGRILDAVFVPYVKAGQYDMAVLGTYNELLKVVYREYNVTPQGLSGQQAPLYEYENDSVNLLEEWDSLPWWGRWAIILGIMFLFFLDIRYNDGNVTLFLIYVILNSLNGRGGGGRGRRGGGGGSSGGGGAGRSW